MSGTATLVKFSGMLKMLNNSRFASAATRAEFLGGNDLDLSVENVKELTTWLLVVSASDADCTAAAKGLHAFAVNAKENLKVVALTGMDEKDAVGDLLAETLRCCNFGLHDSKVVKDFIEVIQSCGISISGNPNQCASMATFGSLGYSALTHQIHMSVTP